MYEQKPVDYLFDLCETNVSKLFDLIQPLSHHLSPNKKKESTSIERLITEQSYTQ